MDHTTRNRFCGSVGRLTSLATALTCVLWVPVAKAVDADIPRLQAGAERGSVQQEVALASSYFAGRGIAQDVKMAAYWYEKAAEGGDPEAQDEIGFMYQTGLGVKADPVRAMHWYQLSASSGSTRAKVNLGVGYFWGLGVRKDEKLAAKLFLEAAKKGDGAAATYVGNSYYFGVGMKEDRAVAESWYEKGVKLHDPVAAYNLGLLYTGRNNHTSDVPKAAALLRKSAEGGYVSAMSSLGALLTNHPDLEKSPHESQTVLETASQAGSWRSSILLGLRARDGKGTAKDAELAYFYFQIAILQGKDQAKSLLANDLKVLSTTLEAEKTSTITADANVWFQKHHLSLAFVYKDGENWKQFPAAALMNIEGAMHAGELVPPPPS